MIIRTNISLFERLKVGLEQGIAHARGKLTLKTVEVPAAPHETDAKTLTANRKSPVKPPLGSGDRDGVGRAG